MLTCKQVHNALANGNYRDLPPLKQWGLRLHVSMCFVCRGFNREIMLFHDTARAFQEHEEELGADTTLPEDARARIREAVDSARAA
jgi:hypothetical protein